MAKIKVGTAVESAVGTLGEYLREQREGAQLSLRQLAEQAGVSNPYLSQIERGLRRPSADVLAQLAKALRISAEQIYVQAGILSPDEDEVREVELAVLSDAALSESQKQALLEVYRSFKGTTTVIEPLTKKQTSRPAPGGSATTKASGSESTRKAAQKVTNPKKAAPRSKKTQPKESPTKAASASKRPRPKKR